MTSIEPLDYRTPPSPVVRLIIDPRSLWPVATAVGSIGACWAALLTADHLSFASGCAVKLVAIIVSITATLVGTARSMNLFDAGANLSTGVAIVRLLLNGGLLDSLVGAMVFAAYIPAK